MPAFDTFSAGKTRSISVKSQLRRTLCAPDHLDVAEGCGADPLAEGLQRSLLRGKSDCKSSGRVARTLRVRLFGLGEQALRDAGSPRQDSPETIDLHGIDPDPD